jgi:hypothetical protein
VTKSSPKWTGPFTVSTLLGRCLDKRLRKPIHAAGLYVVSGQSWVGSPSSSCGPLYVGQSEASVWKRLGDLLADTFGFYVPKTGRKSKQARHSGGQSLHKYCKKDRVNPNDLFVGWLVLPKGQCVRCAEAALYASLCEAENRPECNIRHPRCKLHHLFA